MIRNLTEHDITLIKESGEKVLLKPSGLVVRCDTEKTPLPDEEGYRVFHEKAWEVIGLPPQEEGVLLLVSRMVAANATDRRDLRVPGTFIREEGKIVGAVGMAALYDKYSNIF